jgi:hypothetical protein
VSTSPQRRPNASRAREAALDVGDDDPADCVGDDRDPGFGRDLVPGLDFVLGGGRLWKRAQPGEPEISRSASKWGSFPLVGMTEKPRAA